MTSASLTFPFDLLALFYQARRAWYFAATRIRGASPSAAAARAAIWQANMVADLCAYADDLYRRMEEIPVLITGETGTGKELAAQCVGWSRYIPFDLGARRFIARYTDDFHARNLCEVPRDLLESALFGHKRGSFTGAAADAAGFFALPKPGGALFLDEIGELPEHVQVKLLRPLQSREYVPLGETHPRPLLGRPIFATHRDLEAMCRDGTFRRDFYERIHGMRIHLPSLRQILAEAPEELRGYVYGFLADKLADPVRVMIWTAKVVHAIHTTRPHYAWPGNLRELKSYTERFLLTGGGSAPAQAPAAPEKPGTPSLALVAATPQSAVLSSSELLGPLAKTGKVSVAKLISVYVTWVFMLFKQNQSETARQMGMNWRTIGRLIDRTRLARWLGRVKKKDGEGE